MASPAEFTRSGFHWDGQRLTLAKIDGPLKIKWSQTFTAAPCLAQSIGDSGWGEFYRQLEYKCE